MEIADYLVDNCFTIEGIVCDGLRGMFHLFSPYPVQMCQFHQISILRRYLTKQPDLEASKALLSIVRTMTHTGKERFISSFLAWEMKWAAYSFPNLSD